MMTRPQPRRSQLKAWLYSAAIIALTPVVAIGVLCGAIWAAKQALVLRGGSVPNEFTIVMMWIFAPPLIIIAWIILATKTLFWFIGSDEPGCCVGCGYDLRGCPSDALNCPECGSAIESPHEKHALSE